MLKQKIVVEGTEITILNNDEQDFISLTDMLKNKDGDFHVSDWLRNRNTLEYIKVWEEMNNPDFNYGEFAIIENRSGLNGFKVSAKELIEKSNISCIKSTTGRYGGTYAHKDIAFEFGMWISPKFKLYLIKDYQRLKDEEQAKINPEWNITRLLAKVNYKIHTDAVKEHLIPPRIAKNHEGFVYANEADILNKALFGMTSKEWREQNIDKKGNIRDFAAIEQLIVLSNLESINAEMIKMQMPSSDRIIRLNEIAIYQMVSLSNSEPIKKIKKGEYLKELNDGENTEG
jgi:KilA-N domain